MTLNLFHAGVVTEILKIHFTAMKLWCVTGAMASSISYRRHQVCAEFEKILSNAGGLLCMHLPSDQILIRQRKLIS